MLYSGCAGLWITTECGKLQISPGEIAVLPQGFRFAVDLPDGPSRGYVAEVFGTHFQLPDLGPIGRYTVCLHLPFVPVVSSKCMKCRITVYKTQIM